MTTDSGPDAGTKTASASDIQVGTKKTPGRTRKAPATKAASTPATAIRTRKPGANGSASKSASSPSSDKPAAKSASKKRTTPAKSARKAGETAVEKTVKAVKANPKTVAAIATGAAAAVAGAIFGATKLRARGAKTGKPTATTPAKDDKADS